MCGQSGQTVVMNVRIDGDRTLPSGYPHVHASEQSRRIAEAGLILRVQVGSGVHRTSITGQDDRDEMGLCLEPPEYVTGLRRVPADAGATSSMVPFEQYERHAAWDRPRGLANRAGAGDLGVIIYSARKWCRLALAGNPTVLLPLFVPDDEVMFRNAAGAELADNAHRFVFRLAADRYLGYLRGQCAAMTGMPSGWAFRARNCSRAAGSGCRYLSRTERTCARSGVVRCR
jgi:uncharacterized protein